MARVEICPRCGQTHDPITLTALSVPNDDGGNVYGICPTNSEPFIVFDDTLVVPGDQYDINIVITDQYGVADALNSRKARVKERIKKHIEEDWSVTVDSITFSRHT